MERSRFKVCFMEPVVLRFGNPMTEDIVAEIISRELVKEGVNSVQAFRIGTNIAKLLEAVNGRYSSTDRHV